MGLLRDAALGRVRFVLSDDTVLRLMVQEERERQQMAIEDYWSRAYMRCGNLGSMTEALGRALIDHDKDAFEEEYARLRVQESFERYAEIMSR